MKLRFTALATTLFALVACGAKGPSTISYSEYRAKLIASEPATWARAQLVYVEKETGKEDTRIEATFNYNESTGWVAEDSQYQKAAQYFMTAKEYGSSLPEQEKTPTLPEGSSYVVNYYADLSMYSKVSYSQTVQGVTMSVEMEGKYEFAQGAWMTHYYFSESNTFSGLTPEMEEATGMKNGTEAHSAEVTINYYN